MSAQGITVGIVGARGYVGVELLRLLQAHPHFCIGFASSRELVGRPLSALAPSLGDALLFESLDADAVAARGAHVVVLALPNGKAAPYVAAIDANRSETVIVDLSADYRFDHDWHYGLPELQNGEGSPTAKRISNPGCYATAMQLAIAPMRGELVGPVQCFGVSGYSGAGTTPSDKNDLGEAARGQPDALRVDRSSARA